MNDRPALPSLLIANDNSRRGAEIGPFIGRARSGRHADPARNRAAPRGRWMKRSVRSRRRCPASSWAAATERCTRRRPALRDTGLPLGILPLGTANDLARTLGIPDEAEGAAQVILTGRLREIDLGTVNGAPFFNVASMGLSVGVTKRLTGIMKRRFGILAYPIAAASTVLRRRRFRASLRADGEEIRTTSLQIAVGNGKFYGGGTVVDAAAAIDDGMLNVYSLEPRARWRLLFMARAFRAGEHRQLREVRTLTCRTVSITTTRPHNITADGEIVARTPAHFGVLARAVRIFAP